MSHQRVAPARSQVSRSAPQLPQLQNTARSLGVPQGSTVRAVAWILYAYRRDDQRTHKPSVIAAGDPATLEERVSTRRMRYCRPTGLHAPVDGLADRSIGRVSTRPHADGRAFRSPAASAVDGAGVGRSGRYSGSLATKRTAPQREVLRGLTPTRGEHELRVLALRQFLPRALRVRAASQPRARAI